MAQLQSNEFTQYSLCRERGTALVGFEPCKMPGKDTVYRGIGSTGWVNRKSDPWSMKYPAFIRKKKDFDGLTVLPEPHQCCQLNVIQICKIEVVAIERVETSRWPHKLDVWQDAIDHACIRNLPFGEDDPQSAEDLATDLASIAEVFSEREFEEAKNRYLISAVEAT